MTFDKNALTKKALLVLGGAGMGIWLWNILGMHEAFLWIVTIVIIISLLFSSELQYMLMALRYRWEVSEEEIRLRKQLNKELDEGISAISKNFGDRPILITGQIDLESPKNNSKDRPDFTTLAVNAIWEAFILREKIPHPDKFCEWVTQHLQIRYQQSRKHYLHGWNFEGFTGRREPVTKAQELDNVLFNNAIADTVAVMENGGTFRDTEVFTFLFLQRQPNGDQKWMRLLVEMKTGELYVQFGTRNAMSFDCVSQMLGDNPPRPIKDYLETYKTFKEC